MYATGMKLTSLHYMCRCSVWAYRERDMRFILKNIKNHSDKNDLHKIKYVDDHIQLIILH